MVAVMTLNPDATTLEILAAYEAAKEQYAGAISKIEERLVAQQRRYELRYITAPGELPGSLFLEETFPGSDYRHELAILPATISNSYFLLREMGYGDDDGIMVVTASLQDWAGKMQ
jgi:hypothetical protein